MPHFFHPRPMVLKLRRITSPCRDLTWTLREANGVGERGDLFPLPTRNIAAPHRGPHALIALPRPSLPFQQSAKAWLHPPQRSCAAAVRVRMGREECGPALPASRDERLFRPEGGRSPKARAFRGTRAPLMIRDAHALFKGSTVCSLPSRCPPFPPN